MSDALAKDDAASVLASIRRLVADRPPVAAVTPVQAPVAAPLPERFLLTPALRVVEGGAGAAPAAVTPEVVDIAQSAPLAPATSDTTAPIPAVLPVFAGRPAKAASGVAADLAAALIIRPAQPAPSRAELDAANEVVADDAAIARLLRSLARSEAPAIVAETLQDICDAEATAAFAPDVAPPAAVALAAAPEAAQAAAPASAPAKAAAAPAIPPSALADEAFLREIVGDVLRQELQGELGERITRNMRKLVRREIYRALAQIEQD